MANYVVCNDTSKDVVKAGICPDDMVHLQPGEGETAYLVPDGVVGWPDLNLDPLKSVLCATIDAQAEKFRQRWITDGTGQAMEYQRAREQADAYLIDPNGAGPFTALQADVNAGTVDPRTGNPVTTLGEAASTILFMFATVGAIGDAIRDARLTSKTAIRLSTTIPDAFSAATVDWEALAP